MKFGSLALLVYKITTTAASNSTSASFRSSRSSLLSPSNTANAPPWEARDLQAEALESEKEEETTLSGLSSPRGLAATATAAVAPPGGNRCSPVVPPRAGSFSL